MGHSFSQLVQGCLVYKVVEYIIQVVRTSENLSICTYLGSEITLVSIVIVGHSNSSVPNSYVTAETSLFL